MQHFLGEIANEIPGAWTTADICSHAIKTPARSVLKPVSDPRIIHTLFSELRYPPGARTTVHYGMSVVPVLKPILGERVYTTIWQEGATHNSGYRQMVFQAPE
jgi:hypothetical protein